jgi:hypothetical protein
MLLRSDNGLVEVRVEVDFSLDAPVNETKKRSSQPQLQVHKPAPRLQKLDARSLFHLSISMTLQHHPILLPHPTPFLPIHILHIVRPRSTTIHEQPVIACQPAE